MTVPFTGGCLCGAVRYESRAEPLITGICHCRDCQRYTGAGGMPGLAVPKDAVTISGELHSYDVTAASGHTSTRSFCPTCGSTVFGNTTQLPDLAVFAAGTLDDPSWYKPAMNIFVADAQP